MLLLEVILYENISQLFCLKERQIKIRAKNKQMGTTKPIHENISITTCLFFTTADYLNMKTVCLLAVRIQSQQQETISAGCYQNIHPNKRFVANMALSGTSY